MGKQGPCCHCGTTTTPLWRNGPADKPVLCNACGSRWRTKGSLLNYMPLHAGGPGLKSKKTTQRPNEHCPQKRKEPSDGFSELRQGSSHSVGNTLEEDGSTWSSTASGISFSESCAQYGVMPARASECWPPWGPHVPSKRRSVMRPPAKRLFFPFRSSDHFCCKLSLEEDLLVDCGPSMTAEIGLGGVLIGPTASPVVPAAQESQSSSFLCDYKEPDQLGALRSDITREESLNLDVSEQSTKQKAKEKVKQLTRNNGPGCTRESFTYDMHNVLQSRHSPLVCLELKDVINFDVYRSLLSEGEREQLMRLVSSADAEVQSPRSMFESEQFGSALRGFQCLLSMGMFDDSEVGLSPRVLHHYQQLLRVPNLATSGWWERWFQLLQKNRRKSLGDYRKIIQGEYAREEPKRLGSEFTSTSATKSLLADLYGSGSVLGKDHELGAGRQNQFVKGIVNERESTRFSNVKAKIAHSPSRSKKNVANEAKLMEAPIYGLLEHEVLLDLPSTFSFQQAELLSKPLSQSRLSPRGTAKGLDQSSKREDDTLIPNLWSARADVDWSADFFNSPSTGSVNE